jgi:hypothetical protein
VTRLVRVEVELERNNNGTGEIDFHVTALELNACFQRARSITVPQFEQVRFSGLE